MSNENPEGTFVSKIVAVLSELDSLGQQVENSADRIKYVVEYADSFVQKVGPNLGVGYRAGLVLSRFSGMIGFRSGL